jgi:succinyl-diaminopimelate desuccinylase
MTQKSSGPGHSAYFNVKEDKHALIEILRIMKSLQLEYIDSFDEDYLKSNIIPSEISFIAGSHEKIEDERLMYLEKSHVTFSPNVSRVLKSLIELHEHAAFPADWTSLYGDTVNPNVIQKDDNDILVTIDVRTAMSDRNKLENYFKDIIESLNSNNSYHVKLEGFGPYFNTVNPEFAKIIQNLGKQNGLDYEITERQGATDSKFINNLNLNIPTIEFGPIGGNAHGSNEFIDLDSLEKLKNWNISIIKYFLEK